MLPRVAKSYLEDYNRMHLTHSHNINNAQFRLARFSCVKRSHIANIIAPSIYAKRQISIIPDVDATHTSGQTHLFVYLSVVKR